MFNTIIIASRDFLFPYSISYEPHTCSKQQFGGKTSVLLTEPHPHPRCSVTSRQCKTGSVNLKGLCARPQCPRR
ncbi:hypothetical protein Q7C36_000420 [Tachysurus vachellii]|uniref:Uncharacterized protein n=1 Tax=Tachysurus vachellii TaxID=175792 RepID=A0AA88TAG2_TACVA|nr:hypothetical protein Q7C36_000420 [Tachysurus vachellii]